MLFSTWCMVYDCNKCIVFDVARGPLRRPCACPTHVSSTKQARGNPRGRTNARTQHCSRNLAHMPGAMFGLHTGGGARRAARPEASQHAALSRGEGRPGAAPAPDAPRTRGLYRGRVTIKYIDNISNQVSESVFARLLAGLARASGRPGRGAPKTIAPLGGCGVRGAKNERPGRGARGAGRQKGEPTGGGAGRWSAPLERPCQR
jgi:hypothetical protein